MSDSPWNQPSMVAGFVQSPPNATLLQLAAREWRSAARLLDIGCGAGRNALPLAHVGWEVVMGAAGFLLDASVPPRELNRPRGVLHASGAPVIYEGVFRCTRD